MNLIAELLISFVAGFILGIGFLYGLATLFNKLFGDGTDLEDNQ